MSRLSGSRPGQERIGRGAATMEPGRQRARALLLAAGPPRPDTLVAWLWIAGALVRASAKPSSRLDGVRLPQRRPA